jgi:membrane associated rhomboid family serine protease
MGEAPPPDVDGNQLAGWRLVLPAVAVFLVPMMAAIAGAAGLRHRPSLQAAGALAGLLVGVLLARLATRRLGTEGSYRP